MPLHKVVYLSNNTKLYLWKITEELDLFLSEVSLKDSSKARLENMKSESHQKGFLAVRMLLQHLNYSDFDLYYDTLGKPHLKMEDGRWKMEDNQKNDESTPNFQHPPPNSLHISISHSHEFSAIAISDENIGLDVEKLKEKTLKIAPRFMDISHLENLSNEDKIKKATVIWGIKESIFKVKNEVGISFPDHISETPFALEDKKATATLNFNNKEENFNIQFDSIEDYIFVCAFEENNHQNKFL